MIGVWMLWFRREFRNFVEMQLFKSDYIHYRIPLLKCKYYRLTIIYSNERTIFNRSSEGYPEDLAQP